jgi:Tat protein translocase TatB subunit
MFDFSLAELLVVIVVAVVFIGPKDIPVIIRAISKAMRAIKGFTAEIRREFEKLAEESGIKESADAINSEIRLIKGDDGNYYESYDLTHFNADIKPGQ